MYPNKFSLSDAVVVVFIAVAVTQLLIACAEHTSTDESRMTNMSQIRDIQQALVLYSQMNNDIYPGISGVTGRRVNAFSTSDENMYGMSRPTNKDVSAVYALLLTGNYVTPEQLVSPLDTETKKAAPTLPAKHTITPINYSYAVLQFGDDNGNEGRRKEWRATGNSLAPVVGDRSRQIDRSLLTTGLHTRDRSGESAKWQGCVGWNDNHVTFETSGVFSQGDIRIGAAANEESDDLFQPNDGGVVDANAMFSYR